MSGRRRRRREEEEERQKHKKALKKSFQKKYSDKKRVGSKRLSDTQKWSLIVGVTFVIIIIISIQFFRPPGPLIYYTEGDFIYATLDQDTQNISFNQIVAYHHLRPRNTVISCEIDDYFDPAFNYDLKTLPETIAATNYSDYIRYSFTEEDSSISFATTMENGTELDMGSWVNLVMMNISPSFISSGVPTLVSFSLRIKPTVAVDRCNISLTFNKTLGDTTLEFISVENGTADEDDLIFTVEEENLAADSLVTLDFTLQITTTTALSELNLLDTGEIHLVLNNKLLKDFTGYSNFKEATVNIAPFYLEDKVPSLEKVRFLDVVIDVPYYNIDIS